MSLNIECEDRVMLTESQYVEILAHFLRDNDATNFINQSNTYIDTLDFQLKRNGKMLRIRNIQNYCSELTLKIKGENGDKEYNEVLPIALENMLRNEHIFPEGEIKDLIISFGINLNELKILTTLQTLRYEDHIEDYLVVIDKNQYNGIIDFNLEIEAPTKKRAHEVMMELCNKFNIEYSDNYASKSKRALSTLFK